MRNEWGSMLEMEYANAIGHSSACTNKREKEYFNSTPIAYVVVLSAYDIYTLRNHCLAHKIFKQVT